MVTFRVLLFLSSACAVVCVMQGYYYLLLALSIAVVGCLSYGVVHPRSSLLCPVRWRLEDARSVALSFDDGPDEKVTVLILDILQKYHTKATFFVIGRAAEKHPELLARMRDEGHGIANHSYAHSFYFNFFSKGKVKEDILRAQKVVGQNTSPPNLLFRPPMGLKNPRIAAVAKDLSLQVISWSLRFKASSVIRGGDIILFHDGYHLFGKKRPQDETPQLLEKALEQISEKQLTTVVLT